MRNEILRRLGWCALLLAIVVVGDRGLAAVLDRIFYQSKFRYALAYSGKLEADVLIMGNSRGANSFHQATLESGTGLRAANLSFNGIPAAMMPVLLEDYLERHPAPQTIIVEVSCVGSRRASGTLERFSVLASRSNGVRDLLREHDFKFYVGSQLSHLLRYNSELMWRSLAFRKKSDQTWAMHSQINDELLESVNAEESVEMLSRSEEDAAAIKRLLEIAESKSIRVELIFAPYLKQYREKLDDFEGWFSWLQEKLERPIVDYSVAIDDSALFADRLHLNASGSEEFTAMVVKSLMK